MLTENMRILAQRQETAYCSQQKQLVKFQHLHSATNLIGQQKESADVYSYSDSEYRREKVSLGNPYFLQ